MTFLRLMRTSVIYPHSLEDDNKSSLSNTPPVVTDTPCIRSVRTKVHVCDVDVGSLQRCWVFQQICVCVSSLSPYRCRIVNATLKSRAPLEIHILHVKEGNPFLHDWLTSSTVQCLQTSTGCTTAYRTAYRTAFLIFLSEFGSRDAFASGNLSFSRNQRSESFRDG